MNEDDMPSFGSANRSENRQPEPVAPTLVAIAPQAQKKSSGLLILVIVLTFVALGGVGFGIFGMVQANSRPNTVVADTKEPKGSASSDIQDANVSFSEEIIGEWGCVSPSYTMDKEDLDELQREDYKIEIVISKDGFFKVVNTVDNVTISGEVIGGADSIDDGKKVGYAFATILKHDNDQSVSSWTFNNNALEDSELKPKQQVVSFSLSSTTKLYCVQKK